MNQNFNQWSFSAGWWSNSLRTQTIMTMITIITTINSMQHNPPWHNEIHLILWNPKVHYSDHKSTSFALFWATWKQSVPSESSLRSILILPSYLLPCLPSGIIPSGIPTTTLYVLLISPIPDTCNGNLIFSWSDQRIIIIIIIIIRTLYIKDWGRSSRIRAVSMN